MITARAARRGRTPKSPEGAPGRTSEREPRGVRARQSTPALRSPLGRITALSMAIGAMSALLLTLIVFAGAPEPVITGVGLLGFSLGWALLAILSTRFTDRPQRWAAVPATVMGVAGGALLILTPDDAALTTAGWIWAPVMLTMAAWAGVHASRSLDTRAQRWMVLPALVLLALVSLGGAYQSLRVTLDATAYPMPGRSVNVGGYSLHLDCAGAGSPTVVLESGLGETSTAWTRIVAEVSETTRVCAYDRAGQAWSDSADSPRDALTIAADLRVLLEKAGESGPYVLVGHPVGGLYAMTFAAEHPSDVAGVVLLDATNPYAVEASLAGRSGGANGPLALLPSLARMGLAQLAPTSTWTSMPAPAAGEYRAFAATARAMTNAVDEMAYYPTVFAQAQTLTTLGQRPLVVLTTTDKARTDAPGFAAQERFAGLSTNSSLRTAETTHMGFLDDLFGAEVSSEAIIDVARSVRSGTPLPGH